MQNLTQSEANSIREVASAHITMHSKLCAYANQCQDQQVKQMLSQAATESQKSAQNLIQML